MKLATLCYITKDNKTLMLHRTKKKHDAHHDKWNGIGGKFETGETPEECVIREVKEETGLTIKNPRLAGRILFPAFTQNPEDWHVYVFTATEFTGELIESNEGDLEWVANDELLNLNLWEGDKLFFKWITEGKYFSAKLIYEREKLLSHTVVFHEF
jgi:8-oxo-dGTP diphosphatase